MANRSSGGEQKRRTAGAGSVDQLPSGRFRVRFTEGTAAPGAGITSRNIGTGWMLERELSNDARARLTRTRADGARTSLAPFFGRMSATISPLHVADWLRVQRKKLVAMAYQGKRAGLVELSPRRN
jgi:hypothetical protein